MQHTEHYELPIYEPDDITSWLKDFNGAMEKIDTGMFTNADDIGKAEANIKVLQEQAVTAHDDINQLTTEVGDIQTVIEGHGQRITAGEQQITVANTNIEGLRTDLASVADVAGTVYRGVLSANETTLAIEIGNFTDTSLVDTYTSNYNVAPASIQLRAASGGQPNLCVMTFAAQSADIQVAVVIRNESTQPTPPEA